MSTTGWAIVGAIETDIRDHRSLRQALESFDDEVLDEMRLAWVKIADDILAVHLLRMLGHPL